MRIVDASELRVGDTIEVWWQPNRDTITAIYPYRGPYEKTILEGAIIAEFAILKSGMTIEKGSRYVVIAGMDNSKIEDLYKQALDTLSPAQKRKVTARLADLRTKTA
jgi:hypothetical protein